MTLRQREPRERDPAFLAFLRTRPCACGCSRTPVEAAHIRITRAERGRKFGMAEKPHDRLAVPLSAHCHRGPGQQHDNEVSFWKRLGIDPFELAAALYQEYSSGRPEREPRPPRRRAAPKRPKSRFKHKWPKRAFPPGRKLKNR